MKKSEKKIVKIQHYGKVTIPEYIRKRFNITEGTLLEVYPNNNELIFKVRKLGDKLWD